MTPTMYYDAGRAYLELHAMRAPVGRYKAEWENDTTGARYEWAVRDAVEDFELDRRQGNCGRGCGNRPRVSGQRWEAENDQTDTHDHD